MSIAKQAYEDIIPQTKSFAAQAFEEVTAAPDTATAGPVDEATTAGPVESPTTSQKVARGAARALTFSPAGWLLSRIRGKQTQFEKSLQSGTENLIGAGLGTAGAIISAGGDKQLEHLPQTQQVRTVRESMTEQAAAGRDIDQWAQEIWQDSQRPELQPAPGSGPWAYMQHVTGQTLPFMAAAMGAGWAAGPVGAFAVGAAAEGDNAYRQARADGATESQAQTERLLVGTINGTIETMQAGQLLRLGKGAAGVTKELADAATQRAWRRLAQAGGELAERDLINAANEGLEEALQEAVTSGAATLHGDTIDLSDWQRVRGAGVGGFTSGAILGVPGVMGIKGGTEVPQTAPGVAQEGQTTPEAAGSTPESTVEPAGGLKSQIGGVALLLDDGTIIKGPGKQGHIDIVDQLPPDKNVVDAGFLNERGEYMYRDDVLAAQGQEARPVSPPVAKHLGKRPEGWAFQDGQSPQAATSQQTWAVVAEAANIPRTLMASMDMSGILRQGAMLGSEHPALYAKMVKRYGQAFYSEQGAQKIQAEYSNNPRYTEAKNVGLDFTEYDTRDIGAREEKFAAGRLLDWLPGVRASGRSFTVALNWMRLSVYDKVVSQAERAGVAMTDKQKQELAAVINDLSGRSKIKSKTAQDFAPFLNAVFFSPRFARSRFRVLEDVVKGEAKSVVRGDAQPAFKEALGGLAGLIGTNLAIMAMLKMIDRDDKVEVEPDLRSADGGKIKIGNQRIDLWAGMLPTARLLVRMVTGQTRTATGDVKTIDRKKLALDFLESKESPLAGLVTNFFKGQDMRGQAFGAAPEGKVGAALTKAHVPKTAQAVGKELWNRLVPMTIQDATDALMVEGVPEAVTAFGLGFFGAGVSTYGPTPSQQAQIVKDEWANEMFGKKWQDLSPSQQVTVRNETPAIDESERAVRLARSGDNPYLSREENDVAKRIAQSLPENVQQELKAAGISTSVSRVVGKDYRLNDRRYQDYERQVTEGMQTVLPGVVDSPTWQGLPPASRERILRQHVTNIKKYARMRVLRDAQSDTQERQVARR